MMMISKYAFMYKTVGPSAELMFHGLICPADNVKVGPDGSVITIVNVRPVNHGAYRCVASNLFGITHTIVSLIVKGNDTLTHLL